MSQLGFTWVNPQQNPLPPGSTATLSFNYDPTQSYELMGAGQTIYQFTPSPTSPSVVQYTTPPLYETTTFVLQIIGNPIAAQQMLTIPVAGGGKVLLQTIDAQNYAGQQWIPLSLPPTYSNFEIVLNSFMPRTQGAVPCAQLCFSNGPATANYCGTSWGNDAGSNQFHEYSNSNMMALWPLGFGGPTGEYGVWGIIHIINASVNQPGGQNYQPPCVMSHLMAPSGYRGQPGAGFVGSYCSNPSGPATQIQIGFGQFNTINVPTSVDAVLSGVVKLYGYN